MNLLPFYCGLRGAILDEYCWYGALAIPGYKHLSCCSGYNLQSSHHASVAFKGLDRLKWANMCQQITLNPSMRYISLLSNFTHVQFVILPVYFSVDIPSSSCLSAILILFQYGTYFSKKFPIHSWHLPQYIIETRTRTEILKNIYFYVFKGSIIHRLKYFMRSIVINLNHIEGHSNK